jgi:hypothetical protein
MGFSDVLQLGAGALPLNNAQFYSLSSQTIANASNPQVVTLTTFSVTGTPTLVGGTKITLANIGNYLLNFSALVHCTSGSNKSLYIWLRKNGADYDSSNTATATSAGVPLVAAASFIVPCVTPGDYYEFWIAGDTTNMQLLAVAASAGPPAYPAAASIIVTLTQIS